MGTKLDQKWAQGIRDNVNALILEIERLESEVDRLETLTSDYHALWSEANKNIPDVDTVDGMLLILRERNELRARLAHEEVGRDE